MSSTRLKRDGLVGGHARLDDEHESARVVELHHVADVLGLVAEGGEHLAQQHDDGLGKVRWTLTLF